MGGSVISSFPFWRPHFDNRCFFAWWNEVTFRHTVWHLTKQLLVGIRVPWREAEQQHAVVWIAEGMDFRQSIFWVWSLDPRQPDWYSNKSTWSGSSQNKAGRKNCEFITSSNVPACSRLLFPKKYLYVLHLWGACFLQLFCWLRIKTRNQRHFWFCSILSWHHRGLLGRRAPQIFQCKVLDMSPNSSVRKQLNHLAKDSIKYKGPYSTCTLSWEFTL